MKVTVEAKLGKIDNKNFIDTQVIIGDTRGNISKFIYETVDKMILENMPQDHLEKLYTQLGAEIQRRIIDVKA